MKRSWGDSTLSWIAPSGHAPTHARHIVQVSWSTAIVPYGAPAGRGISDRDEAQLGRFDVVLDRAFGARPDARETHRASVVVDSDRAVRRAGRQRNLALRNRRVPSQVLDRECRRRTLVGGERKGRRDAHDKGGGPRPQCR